MRKKIPQIFCVPEENFLTELFNKAFFLVVTHFLDAEIKTTKNFVLSNLNVDSAFKYVKQIYYLYFL